jgi:hypothetical protein
MNDSDGDEYRLAADDVVTIEDGTVYYEGPDPSVGPKTLPATGKRPAKRG